MLSKKTVRILQLQLEQDSGKSLHDDEGQRSLIDLNRAGIGLMEIISAPDFSNGLEAAEFIKELQLLVQVIGTCDGKMSEGSMRIDANISVRQPGDDLGVRTEVKNLNSMRSVVKAIDYEIQRQITVLESGGNVVNETLTFLPESDETTSMRDKESDRDYRFMPEPNLPPLRLYDDSDTIPSDVHPSQIINISTLRTSLPELPEKRRMRLHKCHGITEAYCSILVNEPTLADYFEGVMSSSTDCNSAYVANMFLNNYLGILNSANILFEHNPIPCETFGYICSKVGEKYINHTVAVKILEALIGQPEQSIDALIKINNWASVRDSHLIEEVCNEIIVQNPDAVAQYRAGKKKVFNFFVGRTKKLLPESVDPKDIATVVKDLLDKTKGKL